MIKLLFQFTLCLVFLTSYSQTDTSIKKDSLIVINEYVYDLDYGISMFHRHCPNQKTYNKNAELLREILYEASTDSKYSIKEIIYYYYNSNNRLISKEFYNLNAELQFLYAYEYDDISGDTTSISKGIIKNNSFIILENTKYKYKKGELIEITRYNNKNKKLSKTIVINSTNQQIRKEIFTKISIQTDSIIAKESTYTFDNNQIVSIAVLKQHTETQSDTITQSYKYNEENFISEVIHSANDIMQSKNVLSYYSDGNLKSKTIFDSDNKKISFSSFEINKSIRPFGGLESAYLKLRN